MTLPTLTPCPKPDCKAPITHWHDDGAIIACLSALNGKTCPHDDPDTTCHTPRETAPASPLRLPDVDTVARAIYESDYGIPWDDEDDSVQDSYRSYAQAVLDLVVAHQPVWKRVEPGALIKAGTRYRRVYAEGVVFEGIAGCDLLSDKVVTVFIDPRTVPASTLTERIRAALNDSPESRITLNVADVEALLDMVGGEGK